LLSADDCKAALAADPHVPRSRLKLAVPFVGKDVPSKSSEFAHPDVIIGLTILAYRYSGLRRDDYIDVVDALTSQFSHEIGPARDRESNLRHERWVYAAGGAIRGLKCTKDRIDFFQLNQLYKIIAASGRNLDAVSQHVLTISVFFDCTVLIMWTSTLPTKETH